MTSRGGVVAGKMGKGLWPVNDAEVIGIPGEGGNIVGA